MKCSTTIIGNEKISSEWIQANQNLTFRVENFGCQMNVADAIEIRASMLSAGFKSADSSEEIADIIIINSCAIRETSEERVYARLRHYVAMKKKIAQFTLVLTGCVAQKEKERVFDNVSGLDFVVGTHEKFRLPEILSTHQHTSKKDKSIKLNQLKKAAKNDLPFSPFMNSQLDTLPTMDTKKDTTNNIKICGKEQKSFVFDSIGGYQFTESVASKKYPFKADIIVIHGCNKFCSYCIVPYTRGPEMSQPSKVIINSAKRLVDEGVTEICLLGQNVNSYGQDINDISLADLLSKLSDISGLRRIRFLTSHPMDFSSELIDAIRDHHNVCNYIHLPIQSASDSVLEKMHREYTYERYLNIISEIREKIPNVVLSTDILIGFPYETESDFEKTFNAMKQIKYDHAYMFKYSVRRGAESAKYPDSVQEEEKKRRLQLIIKTQQPITQQQNQKDLGKIEEVLLEGKSRNNPNQLIGKTDGNKPVIYQADASYIGTYRQLKLSELKGNTFIGVDIK